MYKNKVELTDIGILNYIKKILINQRIEARTYGLGVKREGLQTRGRGFEFWCHLLEESKQRYKVHYRKRKKVAIWGNGAHQNKNI